MEETINIPIEVIPDLIFVKEEHRFSGSVSYSKHYFVFSHSMVVIKECSADGAVSTYNSVDYVACRIMNGRVEVLDKRHGWKVDAVATRALAEKEAEKELLK